MGVLLVVSVIIAAVATTSVGATDPRCASSTQVCKIAGGADCGLPKRRPSGGPTATGTASATPTSARPGPTRPSVDSDGDGLADGEDPNPSTDDADGDGLLDAEELALGSDPTRPTPTATASPTARSSPTAPTPPRASLPLTEENALRPWERVGMTEEEWNEFTDAILDEVNPGGWEGFLFGNPYWGVTLDEDGNLQAAGDPAGGPEPGAAAAAAGRRQPRAERQRRRRPCRRAAARRGARGAGGPRRDPGRRAHPAAGCRPPRPGTALGELDALGRTTGASATITRNMLNTGTSASRSITPAGYQAGAGQARGHLIARLLGGSGRDARNLATIYQNPRQHADHARLRAAGGQRRPCRRDRPLHRSRRSTAAAS